MKSEFRQIFDKIMNEAVSAIDADIDFIYDTYFKDYIDQVNKTGKLPSYPKETFLDTSILKEPRSIESNEKNPCTIILFGKGGNHYSPDNSLISIDLPREAIKYIDWEYRGDFARAVSGADKQANQLRMELTEQRIKGSIHHELAHWIDDSIHGTIKNVVKKAKEQGTSIQSTKGKSINTSEFEMEAQIHNIIQTKRTHEDAWDHMTFEQMIHTILPIKFAFEKMDKPDKEFWQRKLRERMAREGLLGKNMTGKIVTESIKIEYKKKLNPSLFKNDVLIPKIREGAIKVAESFIKSLDMPKLEVADYILVGSNAAYNYTEYSDFDLHIVVDFDKAIKTYGTAAPLYFQAMKSLWNQNHSIKLGMQPVEVYIQDTNDDLVASGIYSIAKNQWITKPDYQKPVIDGDDVEAKVTSIEADIDSLLSSNEPNKNRIKEVMDSLRDMRKAGLAKAGEFSSENLTYKQLRNNGTIGKLFDAYGKAGDKELTVEQMLDESEDDLVNALKKAIHHLEGDTKQKDIPPDEHAEDLQLVDYLKTVLASNS